MELVIGWISILISSFFFIGVLGRLINGGRSILFVSEALFYIIHIIPYAILLFFQLHAEYRNYPNTYRAILDSETNIAYSIFILFIMGSLHVIAYKAWLKRGAIVTNYAFDVSGRYQRLINALLAFGMLSPLLLIFIAPNPDVYLNYAYFYTHRYSVSGLEYIFHQDVTKRINFFAFLCMSFYYYRRRRSTSSNALTMFSIFIIAWFDGKRALLCFSFISILIIDWVKSNNKDHKKILWKGILFAFLMISYFLIQGDIAGKSVEGKEFISYELYFSRMSAVMTTIYDWLNEGKMLDYSGQSILYDLLFFVPRELWIDKPVMFCKYYTSYAMGVDGLSWNLLVNIWSEFIANFGAFLGPLLGLVFLSFVAKISEKSNNKYIYIFGMIFCAFYTVFGFEFLTTIIYLIWIGLIIGNQFRKICYPAVKTY